MNPFYYHMPTSNSAGIGFINGPSRVVSPKTTLLNNNITNNSNNNGVNGFGNQISNLSKDTNHGNSLPAI